MRFAPLPRWTWAALAALALLAPVACGPNTPGPPPDGDTVTVRILVEGPGRVAYVDPIACTDDCTWELPADEAATLSAIPSATNVFVAWDGPCPSTLSGGCQRVFEDGDVLTARFAPHALRLDLTGDGEGEFRIQGGGIDEACDSDCGIGLEQPLANGLGITHYPLGSARTVLGPWGGACVTAADARYCLVPVSGATTVTKIWRHPPLANDGPDVQAVAGTPRTVPAPGVLANDEDTPGDVLSAELVAEVSQGQLTLRSDGGFTYTGDVNPGSDAPYTDSFTYRARDAFGNQSNVATVTITVSPPATAIGGITLVPDAATLDVDETLQLEVIFSGVVGDPLRTVTWASSDDTIASVDTNGIVTAEAPGGPVTITATSTFDDTKQATAAITVREPDDEIGGLTIEPISATLEVGGTVDLTVTLTGVVGNPDPTLSWSNGDPNVVTIESTGLNTVRVTAEGPGGPVNVTATSNFDTTKSATATITVEDEVVITEGITVEPAEANLRPGATQQFEAIVTGAKKEPTLVWSTSNPAVATVSATGLVRAESGGDATITATDLETGLSATALVKVRGPPI